jgi:hypothetical protein
MDKLQNKSVEIIYFMYPASFVVLRGADTATVAVNSVLHCGQNSLISNYSN